MRKIKMAVFAVFAVFAFSALVATSALAVSKVLSSGEEILAALPIQLAGSWLWEDMGAAGPPDLLCSGIFDGTLNVGGTLLSIEHLLTSGGVQLENNLIECIDLKNICSSPVNFEELNLPWDFTIELDAALTGEALTVYLGHFLTAAEAGTGFGEPEYNVDCNSILGLVAGFCKGLTSVRLLNNAAGISVYFNSLELMEPFGAASEPGNCSSGAEQGLLESLNEADEADTENGGGLMTDTSDTLILSLSE